MHTELTFAAAVGLASAGFVLGAFITGLYAFTRRVGNTRIPGRNPPPPSGPKPKLDLRTSQPMAEAQRENITVSIAGLRKVLAFKIEYGMKGSAATRRYYQYALTAEDAWSAKDATKGVVDVEITLCELYKTEDDQYYFETADIPSPVSVYTAAKEK